VARSLTDSPPWLNCRFLYDETGSRLFEEITAQPEYYLTRTENAILKKHAGDIRDLTGPMTLIELGSGYSVKTAHLLRAYGKDGAQVRYVPVDVSLTALKEARKSILLNHPGVQVQGIRGTYQSAFPLFEQFSPAMVMFLGSTIGNFNVSEADHFWNQVGQSLAPGDFFLLGVDLVKDKTLLEAAYNDAAGVTEAFTKNLFARINRELGAGVDLNAIEHVASYNPDWQRIETFIRFRTEQQVYLKPIDQTISIAAGTMVMTEISRKFTLDQIQENMGHYGLAVRRAFTDGRNWFAVLLLERSAS
jgi:L-histidine Nalpha-methyltransferase